MPTHVAPRRDFHGLEVRRKQAARLFATGRETQGAIARRLGVSRQSVMRWYQAWRSGGREALRAAGRAGRKPRLAPEQLTRVDKALREGPRAHGFSTGLWTLPRVALVIKRVTGAKYHPGHVWRLLGALDWTLQRPAKRGEERNGAAVRRSVTARRAAVKTTRRGCGPELNTTELVWGNVKGRELANLRADNLGEVERAVRTGLRRVRRAPTLAFAFLRHAGLSF